MTSIHTLNVSAAELEQLSRDFPNTRVSVILENAARAMRVAAEELSSVNDVPMWVVPLQDSVHSLALAITHAGWVTRTSTMPGSNTYNVHKYAIDSYERLAADIKSNVYATTRASRRYPHTTRRAAIRKELKNEERRFDS